MLDGRKGRRMFGSGRTRSDNDGNIRAMGDSDFGEAVVVGLSMENGKE